MRRWSMVPLLVVIATSGCTSLIGRQENEAERRLATGLHQLEQEKFAEAFDNLVWVSTRHPNDATGQRALLALASLDLDPRNPVRRIGIGSQLAARYLGYSDTPDWVRPAVKVLYLLGQELGAAEERVVEAEEEKERAEARAKSLPTYSGQSVPQRIRALSEERDRLARRVTQLEQELARKNQELERIRKTLRP